MPATPIVQPAADLAPFAYEENQGSPREQLTDDGFKATRELICDWDDRLALMVALKGRSHTAGGRTVLTAPQSYPGFAKALVRDVACDPFSPAPLPNNGNPKDAAYTKALLTVQYETPKYESQGGGGEDEGQAFVSESLEPAAEFITLSHEKLWWDAAKTTALAETEAPTKLIRMLDWVYTIHRIDAVPAATFSLVGKVNDAAVFSRSLQVTFAEETLLYNPPRLSREWTSEGLPAWSLEYRFTYRPEGWNKFYRRGVEAPARIYNNAGAIFYGYTLGDFGAIVG